VRLAFFRSFFLVFVSSRPRPTLLTRSIPAPPSPFRPPADGALLVYDITDEASFARVKEWVKELRKILGEDITIAIAGNKVDMEKSRNVNKEEAIRYTQSVGGSHHLTSAKSGAGINEAFTDLLKRVVAKKRAAASAAAGADKGPARTSLRIVDEEPGADAAQKGCCG
jgi:Ras-related protein Rab-21